MDNWGGGASARRGSFLCPARERFTSLFLTEQKEEVISLSHIWYTSSGQRYIRGQDFQKFKYEKRAVRAYQWPGGAKGFLGLKSIILELLGWTVSDENLLGQKDYCRTFLSVGKSVLRYYCFWMVHEKVTISVCYIWVLDLRVGLPYFVKYHPFPLPRGQKYVIFQSSETSI